MSATMMQWAWRQALAPRERLVLLALADECGDDGLWLSNPARLAAKAGADRLGLDEALGALEAAGLAEAHRHSDRLSVRLLADGGEVGGAGLGVS